MPNETPREVVLLLVDDDAVMHKIVPSILMREPAGRMTVLHAFRPDEALELLEKVPEGSLIVLSDHDLGTPQTGIDLLRELAVLRPDAVRLLYSGHPLRELEHRASGDDIPVIHQMPINAAEFAREFWTRAGLRASG